MDTNQQKALLDILQVINTLSARQPLLEKVMDIATEALGAERGFLVLRDEESGKLKVEVARNMSSTQADQIARPASSVIQQVFQDRLPVLTHDAVGDPRFAGSQTIVWQKITAIASVPLVQKGEIIGVIYLDSSSNRQKFEDSTIEFLQAFSNQAAIAIENANFLEKLQAQNELLQIEKVHLQTVAERAYDFKGIVGSSAKTQEVLKIVSKIVRSDISVLLQGESGTGKELVARAIHYNSHRKDRLFVAQFCGNLSEHLLESELFGHKKGSFTGAISDKRGLFEIADGGTFFLDEIADISPVIQAKLLRVLQEGTFRRVGDTEYRTVNVRIISATNKNLADEVKKGNFREDLFYRLNVITITMPPLRERRSDIELLVKHFLRKVSDKTQERPKRMAPEALRALTSHDWPGNVRELENTIERSFVLAGDNPVIGLEELALPQIEEVGFKPKTLKEFEKDIVMKTLQDCEGNKTKTAEVLGVSLRWLHYKLNEWQAPKSAAAPDN